MNLRHLPPVPLAAAIMTAVLLAPPLARADDDGGGGGGKSPFVDVPLTLKPLHFAADAAIGFGTYEANGGSHVGWGSNLDASIGLPFLGEFGADIAERFGTDGDLVGAPVAGPMGADHFARLFDPVLTEPGGADFANPEFHLRGTMVPLDVFELGLETRLTVPTSNGSFWTFTPGLPMRIHLPGIMRIDVGLWLPILLEGTGNVNGYNGPSQVFVLDIPVQAWFQIGDAFVGPESGLRIVNIGGSPSSTDIPVGVGGGYTFGGILDVKAQLRTERINSAGWASNAFGGGLGVGLRVP
jgi:hypothetical protein